MTYLRLHSEIDAISAFRNLINLCFYSLFHIVLFQVQHVFLSTFILIPNPILTHSGLRCFWPMARVDFAFCSSWLLPPILLPRNLSLDHASFWESAITGGREGVEFGPSLKRLQGRLVLFCTLQRMILTRKALGFMPVPFSLWIPC